MVLGFSTKSKPDRPKYEEQADTPWITRNRDMNTWSYKNIADNINRVNMFDDATKQSINNRVDDVYNRALGDFNRNYTNTMNNYLSRDYNRFGTTGASNSLYNRDQYNLQQQRKLADLAYDKAITQDNLMDAELNRRYKFLDTNYNYFTNSGNTAQTFDNANWDIRNLNKDIQYLNDIQDYNNSFEHVTDKLVHQIGGAVAGFWLKNPELGKQLGDTATNAFASDAEYLGNGYSNNATWSNPFNQESMYSLIRGYNPSYQVNTNSNGSLWGNIIPLSQLVQSIYGGNYSYSYPDYGSYGSLVTNPYWDMGYNIAG